MHHAMLIAAALIGPSDLKQPLPAESTEQTAEPIASDGLALRQVNARDIRVRLNRIQLRALYTQLIRETARGQRPDPMKSAPRLLDLFHLIPHVERVSQADKTRMRKGLTARLEEMAILLNRQLRRTSAQSQERRTTRQTGKTLAGPAEQRNARELINLIQAAVAPDSWDVNGGKGTIFFYSPLNVLVIRATGDVHREVGDTLDLLR